MDVGDEYPSSTSRGSCLEPKHLSMSFNLNQISIFMSGRCKHWVRNQSNLKRSGCILAQMGLCPDTFFFSLFTLCCTSHSACQKIAQPGSYFCGLPHSVTVTYVAFFCLCPTDWTRHWDTGSVGAAERHVERQKKEEGKGTPMHGEDGTVGALFSDQHMCVFVWQSIGEGV